jgi:hypothetical protein
MRLPIIELRLIDWASFLYSSMSYLHGIIQVRFFNHPLTSGYTHFWNLNSNSKIITLEEETS